MRVRDLMTSAPITVPPGMPVLEARELMSKHRFRHLLVVEDGRLAGVVTDRDIRLNLPSQATSLSLWELNYLLARLTVGTVMTKAVIMVDPAREAAEAARLMLDHQVGCLPVTDGDRLVGILTESDFLRAFIQQSAPAGR
ncbi:MAG TPA: CBS domain-containing protein [Candidatus Nitrosocosmicus sp.]|jgi:acetoin utilization protein AcuB|nr:CBS domain-containing protein [Candidatus Nitrosocosmicus sp.]